MHCTVVRRVGRDSYKLALLEGMERIHLVFYTSLIRLDPNDLLLGQAITPQPLVRVLDETDNEHDK